MRRILSLLALVLPLTLIGQTKSLLWEITGNGLTKPSYLYGTMHVSDKIAFHLTDSFFIALKSADVIALESNPEHWIENDFGNPDKSGNYSYNESSYYNNRLFSYSEKDFYSDVSAVFVPDDEVYLSAYGDDSWLVNGYLYRYNDREGDYAEETYLDLFIFQCGKKLNKKIAALEKEQEVLKLLQEAYNEPEDNEKEEEADFIEKKRIRQAFEDEDESVYEMIDEAYRDGDLERLDSLEILVTPSSRYHQYFIVDRNKNMVRRMDSIMQQGKIIFTGIGAAHLPGNQGAINLLREMGYTVRPVQGKVSNKSIKEKEKIDAMIYAQSTKKQYATDSLFSVVSPGKLYVINDYKSNTYMLYPDMANSAYYSVLRIAHHAHMEGKTPDEVLAGLEKMFYEYIPGDIQTQTAIKTNNGWPGYDIVSKTKRGFYQRYRIIVSPLETIIFKGSGIGTFVTKSKEMQAFFNSITFREDLSGWETHSPAWGLFELQLPKVHIAGEIEQGETILNAETISTGEGAENNNRYFFTAYYLNDFTYLETDSFELARLSHEFADQMKKPKYNQEGDYVYNQTGQYPTAESIWNNGEQYCHIKTTLKGPYYVVLAAFTDSPSRPDTYFDSFRFKDLSYSQPFTVYTDTSLYYQVETIFPKPDTILTIDEIEYNGYDYDYDYYGYDNDDEELDDSFETKNRTSNFRSEVTPENVYVQYHKFHDFNFEEDTTTFWNSFDSLYTTETYHLSRKVFTANDSIQSLSFLITRDDCSRGVYKKFILEANGMLVLSTTIDTLSKPSPMIERFYATCVPSDSISGKSIFVRKSDDFFAALNGTDTVLYKQALASTDVIDLEDADADKLIAYIQGPEYKKLKTSEKTDIIELLGDLNGPNVLAALKQIYLDAGDSTSLQIATMTSISRQETKEAYTTFKDLLYIETPLTEKEYETRRLFLYLADSVELTATLFPALFDFTSLPEYQESIFELLTELYIEDSSATKYYMPESKQIISLATAELKRNLTNEEDELKYKSSYYNNYKFKNLKNITTNTNYISTGFFGNGLDYTSNYYNYSSNVPYYLLGLDMMNGMPEEKYNWANDLIDYYAVLLNPLYHENPSVKKFYDRILRSKNSRLKSRTALTMLQSGLPVPDSVITDLQKNQATRYDFTDAIMSIKLDSLLDSAYNNQLSISEAILYGRELEEEDSLVFLKKVLVETPDTTGYVYFFKSKIGSDKGWSLDCSGLQPLDTTQIEINPLFVYYGEIILDEEDQQEQIDEIIKNLALYGRSRVKITFGKQNNYDYEYWDY